MNKIAWAAGVMIASIVIAMVAYIYQQHQKITNLEAEITAQVATISHLNTALNNERLAVAEVSDRKQTQTKVVERTIIKVQAADADDVAAETLQNAANAIKNRQSGGEQ